MIPSVKHYTKAEACTSISTIATSERHAIHDLILRLSCGTICNMDGAAIRTRNQMCVAKQQV